MGNWSKDFSSSRRLTWASFLTWSQESQEPDDSRSCRTYKSQVQNTHTSLLLQSAGQSQSQVPTIFEGKERHSTSCGRKCKGLWPFFALCHLFPHLESYFYYSYLQMAAKGTSQGCLPSSSQKHQVPFLGYIIGQMRPAHMVDTGKGKGKEERREGLLAWMNASFVLRKLPGTERVLNKCHWIQSSSFISQETDKICIE